MEVIFLQALIILIKWIDQFFFPQYCCLCKSALKQGEDFCKKCYKNLPWNKTACRQCALPLELDKNYCGNCLQRPPLFIYTISPFRYEPPVSSWIIQLKFHHQLRFAGILGRILAEKIRQLSYPLPQCIIPVPLHHWRLRRRGFNQAGEIAKTLGKIFHLPVLSHCVRRNLNTPPQSQLSARQRRKNLHNVFSISTTIPYDHIAIVDDVMTTGQTARALSEFLHQQGIKTIEIWCCARA